MLISSVELGLNLEYKPYTLPFSVLMGIIIQPNKVNQKGILTACDDQNKHMVSKSKLV